MIRREPGDKITQQMSYFLDASAVQVVQNIAQQASQPGKSTIATIVGVTLALFGASGVFDQLQDALNTIWDVKAKPHSRHLGISAESIPVIWNGRWRLFSPARLTHARKPAQSLQPLRTIDLTWWSRPRDGHLCHI